VQTAHEIDPFICSDPQKIVPRHPVRQRRAAFSRALCSAPSSIPLRKRSGFSALRLRYVIALEAYALRFIPDSAPLKTKRPIA
jgi:hypothetical protein